MEGRSLARAGQCGSRSTSALTTGLMCVPPQFRILREKDTEPAGTGKFDKHYDEGVYSCAGCGTPLYKSATKFKSGCGWPAFFDGAYSIVHSRES